jgi:hypothetical protein
MKYVWIIKEKSSIIRVSAKIYYNEIRENGMLFVKHNVRQKTNTHKKRSLVDSTKEKAQEKY